MGFLKSVAKVISAPVTAPLKVASNVIREGGEAFGVEKFTAPLSTLAAAPYAVTAKGESIQSVLPNVASSVRELAPLASVAAGPLAGAGVGSSLLTGMSGGSLGDLLNGFTQPNQKTSGGGSAAPVVPTPPPAILAGQSQTDFTMPLILGGGFLVVLLLVMRK